MCKKNSEITAVFINWLDNVRTAWVSCLCIRANEMWDVHTAYTCFSHFCVTQGKHWLSDDRKIQILQAIMHSQRGGREPNISGVRRRELWDTSESQAEYYRLFSFAFSSRETASWSGKWSASGQGCYNNFSWLCYRTHFLELELETVFQVSKLKFHSRNLVILACQGWLLLGCQGDSFFKWLT